MEPTRWERIVALLKSIQTGDPEPLQVVDEARYIQHNPQTHEGSEGLAALFKRLSLTDPRVAVVRVFEDGDYVFAHTEYDFSNRNIGFEVFRFDGDKAVEHWDNIQRRRGPNPSGHGMVDGPTEPSDLDRTETNRALVQRYVEEVLIPANVGGLRDFIDPGRFVEHNPERSDGIGDLEDHITGLEGRRRLVEYHTLHRVLAEGDFVLTVCEGRKAGVHTSFYDLHRVSDGKIVEHWDTIEAVAPASEWKNSNGKF